MFPLFFRSLSADQGTMTLAIFASTPLPESLFPSTVTGFSNSKCKQLHLTVKN